jgi:hypothetical protein
MKKRKYLGQVLITYMYNQCTEIINCIYIYIDIVTDFPRFTLIVTDHIKAQAHGAWISFPPPPPFFSTTPHFFSKFS